MNLSIGYAPICLTAGKRVKMRQAGSEATGVRTDDKVRSGAALGRAGLAQYLVRVRYPTDPSLSTLLHEIAAGEGNERRGAQKHPRCA